MIFRKAQLLPLLALIALAGLAGCTSHQTITLALDDRAHISVQMEIGGFFEQYLRDLGSANDTGPLFDEAAILAGLAKEGVSVTALSSLGNKVSLELDLRSPVRTATTSYGSPNLIRWNPTATPAEFALTFDQQSIRRILSSASGLDQDSVEYLMPGPGSSREAYEEDLVWIFGDYSRESDIRAALRAATIRVEFMTPREILTVSGPGLSRTAARTAVLSLPVLEFLTDPAARTYRIRY